ncbi:fimbrial biogenesis chaperone [Serratia oryzae]|uniref:fimbrial biogenesis chaperone n=1 Tax=Serratia oryzae TaxID=2034155 RepID=UPI0012E20403|nr:fimbria/pilus periplasmic chaperone [Serratia oryzae]
MVRQFLTIFMMFIVVLKLQASTQLASTRIVFPADEREVTVQLYNPATNATLVQSWIDSGDRDVVPPKEDIPFLILPPLVRINPEQGAALKIIFTGQGKLPQDKETLFWLNVMDIPPLARGKSENHIQIAYRTRVKLFFRPAGLRGSAEQAIKSVVWKTMHNEIDDVLQGCNKSRFFVSINRISVIINNKNYTNELGGSIAPGECEEFSATAEGNTQSNNGAVAVEWINDYGMVYKQEGRLSNAP